MFSIGQGALAPHVNEPEVVVIKKTRSLGSTEELAKGLLHQQLLGERDPLRIHEPRLGDGTLCRIFSAGVLRSERCFAPDDGAGAGGGGGGGGAPQGGDPPPPKTFTQEDFDRAIGKVRQEERARFKDYDQVKAAAGRLPEIEAELTRLRDEKEMAGKTAQEQEKIAIERREKAWERERKELGEKYSSVEKERDGWRSRYLEREISDGLGRALDGAKVLTSARSEAIDAFRRASELEHDDDGRITGITYDGIAFKTVAEAATAFLKNKPFFASNGGVSGGGTKPPNGGGGGGGSSGGTGRALHERSEDELLRMDAQRQRNTR